MRNRRKGISAISIFLLIVMILNTCFAEIRIEDIEVVQTETQLEYSMNLDGSTTDLDVLPYKFELYESDVKVSDSGWIDSSNENLTIENQVINKTSSIEGADVRVNWNSNNADGSFNTMYNMTGQEGRVYGYYRYDRMTNQLYLVVKRNNDDYYFFRMNKETRLPNLVCVLRKDQYHPYNYNVSEPTVCNGYIIICLQSANMNHILVKSHSLLDGSVVNEKRVDVNHVSGTEGVMLDSNQNNKNHVFFSFNNGDYRVFDTSVNSNGSMSVSKRMKVPISRGASLYTIGGNTLYYRNYQKNLAYYNPYSINAMWSKTSEFRVYGFLKHNNGNYYLLTNSGGNSMDGMLRKLNISNGETEVVMNLNFSVAGSGFAGNNMLQDENGNIYISGNGLLVLNQHFVELKRFISGDIDNNFITSKFIYKDENSNLIFQPNEYYEYPSKNNHEGYTWGNLNLGSAEVKGVRINQYENGLRNNQSRRSVQLENGWIVVSTINNESGKVSFYVDKNDGTGFKQSFWIELNSVVDWSIDSIGNSVVFTCGTSNNLYADVIDIRTVENEGKTPRYNIANYSTFENCDISVSKNEEKVAITWLADTNNSLEVVEGSILSQSDIHWGNVESVYNSGELHQPSISYIENGQIIVVYRTVSNPTNGIVYRTKLTSGAYSKISITSNNNYPQVSPSIGIHSDGRIIVAWQGQDANNNYRENIRYSESTDNGITWSDPIWLTSNKENKSTDPNVIVDVEGNIRVLYSQVVNEKTLTYIKERVKSGSSFGGETTLIDVKSGNGQYVKSSEPSLTPLFIFEDHISKDVKFYGQWIDKVNVKYTFKDLSSSKKYKIKAYVKKKDGEVLEFEKTVDTEAVVPSLTIDDATVTDSELIVKLSDTNSKETTYKFYANDQYINIYGEIDEGVDNWYKVFENSEGVKTFTIRGLQPGKTYEIKVIAQNTSGVFTAFSQPISVTMKNTAPNGVVETIDGVSTTDEIRLSWDAVEHASSYVIKVGDKTIEVEEPHVVLKTGLIDGLDILPDSVYKVSVAAKNSISTTEFSLPTSFKTLKTKPLAPVLSVSSVTNHSIGLSWTEISGVNKYELEIDGRLVDVHLDNIYMHKDLEKKSQHAYRIRCYNSDQVSDWSEGIVTMTTNNAVEIALQDGVEKKSNESVTLSWNAVTNAENYYVQVDGGEKVKLSDNTYTKVSGLKPSTAYNIKVFADETGQPILNKDVTTFDIGTPRVNLSLAVQDEVTLSWNAIDGATSYEIIFDEDTSKTVNVTGHSHTMSKADATNYQTAKVRAMNTTDNKFGGWSNLITIMYLENPPNQPTNLRAISSDNEIVVLWDEASGDNIHYDIEVDGVIVETLSPNKYVHEDIESYSSHQYRIRTKSDLAEGLWTAMLKVMSLPSKPLPPEGVVIKNARANATLSWDEMPSAESYEVKVNEDKVYKLGTQTTFTHRGITLNKESTYRIRANNIIGSSEWGHLIVNNSLRAVCKKNKTLDLGLTASNIQDFSKYTLQVTYNPNVLEVTDLCGYTSANELAVGKIISEDIEVVKFEEKIIDGEDVGVIVFKVSKPVAEGYSWTGIVDNIKFKPLLSGATYLSYTVIIDE